MLEFTVIIQNMRVILYFIYKWEVIVDLNPILLTLWASLSATTQQDGKADGAPSSALPMDRGRPLHPQHWTP